MSTPTPYDALAAVGLVSLLLETTKIYRQAAPPLPDLRSAQRNDPYTLQLLVDADITVGIPALAAGALASWLMRSWWPLIIVTVAMIALAGYHHSILYDPTP